ncbi:hypothetical protein ACEUAY_11635 [Aeromonas veronii]
MYREGDLSRKGLVLIFISLLTFSCSVRAIIVQADITGGTFRWRSASPAFIKDSVVPAIWDTPIGLTPSYAFYPGGGRSDTIDISLFNGGSSVKLPLKVNGMEYNSPEAIGLSPSDSSMVTLLGTLVQVNGYGISNTKVFLNRQVTPFTHARPVFSLGSSGEIISAFKGAPPGIYRGSASIPLTYDYDLSQSKVRYNWSLSLDIEIDYTPAYLSTVVAFGDYNIIPSYYREDGQHYIAGETIYRVKASGYFTDGLLLRLRYGDEYKMMKRKDVSLSSDDSIPFSVICSDCFDTQLVEHGEPMAQLFKAGTTINGSGNDIDFELKIQFKALVGDVTDGVYNGRFAVIISPKI